MVVACFELLCRHLPGGTRSFDCVTIAGLCAEVRYKTALVESYILHVLRNESGLHDNGVCCLRSN
jgi:hypothetical protein